MTPHNPGSSFVPADEPISYMHQEDRRGAGSQGIISPKSSAHPMSPSKSSRTHYPPLPESTMSPQRTLSPSLAYERERERRRTKTPSIAPSESASQVPRKREKEKEKEPSLKPARSEVDGRNGSGGSRERSRVEGLHSDLQGGCDFDDCIRFKCS